MLRDLEMVKQRRLVERRRGSGFQAYKDMAMEGTIGDFGYIADIPNHKEPYNVVKVIEEDFDLQSVVGKTFGFDGRLVVRAHFAKLEEVFQELL